MRDPALTLVPGMQDRTRDMSMSGLLRRSAAKSGLEAAPGRWLRRDFCACAARI